MHNFFGNGSPPGSQRPLGLQELNLPGWSRAARWALVGLAVLLLLLALNWARGFYTDWLWFSNLGYQQVLLKIVTTRLGLFALGALTFMGLSALNLYLAYRMTRGEPSPTMIALTPEAYVVVRRLLAGLAAVAVVLISLAFATAVASQWSLVLRFTNAATFDLADPIFGKDVQFYVFTLPLLHFIRSWLLGTVVISLIITGGLHILLQTIQGQTLVLPRGAKLHLTILGAGVFLLIAAGHWLGRYDLLYSTTGSVYGVGYTAAHASLPARQLLTGIAVASAALMVAGGLSSGYRLIVGAVALWVGLALIAGNGYPVAMQRFQVEPSELAKEEPYLAHNIRFTRQAYALEEIQSQAHPAVGILDRTTVTQNQGTVQNIRLWDEGPLLDSYNQIQFFRLYYDFLDVSTDRYQIDGRLMQVMLATRELSADKLPAEAQRWVNRHLQFTHGYGVAMSPVAEVAPDGRPAFLVRDVPSQSSRGAPEIQQAEIYYGLKSLDFVIAPSRMREFNYPGPQGPEYNQYDGQGGVLLDSFLKRLLYAWQFGDVNILISGEIQPESRIQYRRTVTERFSTITPFLVPDRDPYVVAADGRLFWIQDAYTVTDKFPYSTPWTGQFNYMRNSVKAVVDAYHGAVDYYVADPTDPLIQTYESIFPGLFKPMEEMPQALRDHIRYPIDFFSVQTQMLLQYHMEEPGVFYNKEDQWSIPIQSSFGRSSALEPYYIVARLPGETQEEFLLIQPFTPSERHNLTAWLAARNDPAHYGERVLFTFPPGRQIDGPNQIEARIDNDAQISEQFTLWGQVGSEVSRGILLAIPMGDAILYAEPVFLKPETLEFPELRRIILADARTVVMQPTLDRAVLALVGEVPAVAPARAGGTTEQPGTTQPPPGLGQQALEDLSKSLEEALKQLQSVLEQLRTLAEGQEESPQAGE